MARPIVTISNAPSFAADLLEPTLDERDREALALGRGARRLDHAQLGIDTHDLPAIGRKADRQNAGPSADVEKTLASIETQRLDDTRKERRTIGRPSVFIIGDCRREAAHHNP